MNPVPHRLSHVNWETREGDCSVCGPRVSVYVWRERRPGNSGATRQKARCILAERVKRQERYAQRKAAAQRIEQEEAVHRAKIALLKEQYLRDEGLL